MTTFRKAFICDVSRASYGCAGSVLGLSTFGSLTIISSFVKHK
jgi:hypothetical protein